MVMHVTHGRIHTPQTLSWCLDRGGGTKVGRDSSGSGDAGGGWGYIRMTYNYEYAS